MVDPENVFMFATGNPHKREEFEELLGDFISSFWDVYDNAGWPEPIPEVEEDADTFLGNALKKADEVSRITTATTIADDSGLVVDALEGRPGVYSSRFAGPDATDADNNRKLIEELQGVPESERTARFVCVAAAAFTGGKVGRGLLERTGVPFDSVPEARPVEEGKLAKIDDRVYLWFKGTVEGRIIDEPRGDHGFGYDPHFYIPEWDKTMAEVPMAKKNEISHRARALTKFKGFFDSEVTP